MGKTKEKIYLAGIALFNELGVNNVTLRDIAERVNISIGNLAYHYKNKDFIIEEAFKKMEERRTEILTASKLTLSFEAIDSQVIPLLELAKEYRFFYLDAVHVGRNYPNIADMQKNFIQNNFLYTKAVINYSIESGNMRAEPFDGYYDHLAKTVCMVMTFWLPEAEINGKANPNPEDIRQEMWNLVYPNLTLKGVSNFSSIYQVANAEVKD